METSPIVEMRNVTFSYDGLPVLEDVTFTIAERDFDCIVGPNGGGKTTLLKLILGLLPPTNGEVFVFGGNPVAARAQIGYMPQYSLFDPQFPIRVIDVVLMGRLGPGRRIGPYGKADREIAAQALRDVELHDLHKRPFSTLSGGQRQRTLIARALASEPKLLLLDEPAANLDLRVEMELYNLLSRLNEKLTILMVSHDLGFVSRYVKSVICVRRTVRVHKTSEITDESLREMYGGDVRIVLHAEHDHYGEDA